MVHRSSNSHQLKLRALPYFARLQREEPFTGADAREWKAAADSFAGPTGWYAVAGTLKEAGRILIHFATPAEADDMQRWISTSGIETRPAPPKYGGPQLGIG